MDRRNVVINGIHTEQYNVFSDGTPDITLPKTDYKILTVPERIMPQFREVPDIVMGSLPLVLNGLFKSKEERLDFESKVIHKIINEAVHTVELGSNEGVIHHCVLGSQIRVTELFEGELIIRYTVDLKIVKTLKK